MALHDLPLEKRWYQHADGDLYQVITVGERPGTQDAFVVYRHYWPFEPKTWVIPYAEWTGFKQVTWYDVTNLQAGDRGDAMVAIMAAREARASIQDLSPKIQSNL